MDQIVLFDGICNLCNGSVRFILKNDKSKRIRVASLQSETGKSLLRQAGFPADSIFTVIYFRGEKIYQRSEAVLQILRDMGGAWKLFYGFIIIPPFIRDFFYNVVARYRYRIFGKRDHCTL
jgi:predicted DCC family thiol-disulfide oxidoreductase YuxK